MKKTRIRELVSFVRGVSYKKEQVIKENRDGYTAVLRANNISDGQFNYKELVYVPSELVADCQLISKGDIVITMSSGSKAHVGKVAIAKYDTKVAFGAFCAKIVSERIVPKYLYYILRASSFRQHIEIACKGTNINNLKQEYILDYEIYLPSVEEQEDIVAGIEEMLSQLDDSVETLKKTKEQLKVYRQAVLKDAFEGKFTGKWRKENVQVNPQVDYERIRIDNSVFNDISGDENEIKLNIPSGWRKTRMGEVFDVQVGATPSRKVDEYWNGKFAWVSSGEVRFEAIDETTEYITEAGLNNSSTNLQPIGTVLLAMIGEGKTRGQAAILNIPAAHNQNTAAILVSKTPCMPKYIYYFLLLNYDNTRRVGSGNNQKALNKERVKAIHFPFCSFAEQEIIVQEIESRLSVCEQVEKSAELALQQAEALRQSILKKAFQGGL